MLKAKLFVRKLSDAQAAEIDEWWRGLALVDRHELCRDRGRLPARVVARFVEPGESTEASDDFYEYLVNHEIYLATARSITSAPPMPRHARSSQLDASPKSFAVRETKSSVRCALSSTCARATTWNSRSNATATPNEQARGHVWSSV